MKIFKSRIIASVLTVAMVFSVLAVPVAAAETTATATTQPATTTEAASFLQEKGLLQGDNGNLMLDQELTREQMVVILSRLMGSEEEAISYPTDNMPFTDVPVEDAYAPYIAWAYDYMITQGMDETTFGFGGKLTAEQTKLFFVRALGYTDLTDEEQLAKADEVGVTAGSTAAEKAPITRANMALLMSNTVFAKTAAGTVLGADLGIVTPAEEETPVATSVEVKSASVATDSTVKVVLSGAVADTTKIAFELKGTTTVQTTVAFNDAKTEATLTAPATLLEGTYTVTATGDGVVAGKNTATVVVAKNGYGKVEILSSNLVKVATDATKVTLKYKVSDCYGVDVTKTTLVSELTVAGTVGSKTVNDKAIDSETGIMTLTLSGALTDTDKTGAVTIIASKNGVVATGTASMTVADAAKVDTITLKPVEFVKTTPVTTKVLVNKATAAYIPVEAKDQYSEVVNNAVNFADQVVVAKTDSTLVVTPEEYTPEGSTTKALRYVVDTTGITVAKTVTVTVVSKLSGKSASITLDIKEAAKPDKVSLGSPAAVVAASDLADTLAIPLTAVDQYGVQLTADEIVTNATNFTVAGTGALAGKIAIATSGENKGKIVNTLALGSTVGTAVVTVSTGTNVATATVDVKDAAYEYAVKVDQAPANNLLMGAVTKMNYKFTDQYGRAIDAPAAAVVTVEVSNANILEATIGGVSTTTSSAILTTNASVVNAEKSVAITTVGTEGSAKVTAKLKKDGSVISTVESTITVTDGVPSTLTFEVGDIATLYSVASGDGLTDGSDKYARAIVLTAKDASGTTYAIPTDRILSVTTLDSDLVTISNSVVTGAAIAAQEDCFVIAAKDSDVAFKTTDTVTSKTATIKVVVSTDAGVKEVTKTVSVSKEAAKVVKVVFADTALDTTKPYALDTDASEIADITGTVTTVTAQKVYVFEVDQYGVYTQVVAPAFKVVNVDKFTGALNYASNQLSFTASQIEANATVYVMYQAAGGAYATFSIKATDGTK